MRRLCASRSGPNFSGGVSDSTTRWVLQLSWSPYSQRMRSLWRSAENANGQPGSVKCRIRTGVPFSVIASRLARRRPDSARARRAGGYRQAALGADELLVRDAVRAVGLCPQPLVAVLLVGLEVALEPDDLRVALEREHVRRDAV